MAESFESSVAEPFSMARQTMGNRARTKWYKVNLTRGFGAEGSM